MVLTDIVTWVMIFWLKHENKKLDRQEAADQESRPDNPGNGDIVKDPGRFRYII